MPKKIKTTPNKTKNGSLNVKPTLATSDKKILTIVKRKSSIKVSASNSPLASESSDESDFDARASVSKSLKGVKFFAEQCILSNSKARPKTSDCTLSSLKEKIDFNTLHLLAKSKVDSHARERERLLKGYQSNFDRWLILTENGFNIMLYGVGSKLQFLDRFVQEKLKDKDTVVVNGFFPGLNVKQILNGIVEEVMNHQGTFGSLHNQAEFIVENLKTDLYLIVHNIDSPILCAERAMSVLCQLSKCEKIHFVATVDHVNSGLIWNSSCAACFKFLWFDATNFLPYHSENVYETSFLVRHNRTLALSSLLHVFCSLTPNAQGIFLLLGKEQLDQADSQKNGLQFKELFRLCREAFLVNSEQTLNTQLTEFKDHNLVRLKKGQDGSEYLHIPVDNKTLKEFIDMQE